MYNGRLSRMNSYKFREIFLSHLDYDIAESNHGLALIRQRAGLSINEDQIIDFKRIQKLNRLGGIRKPLTEEEFNQAIEQIAKRNLAPRVI